VPSTWKPEGALACGFEGAGVAGRGTETAGLGGVVAGALGLVFVGVLDLGRVAVFGLVLAAGLDLAFRDGDLVCLTVLALDLAFALLLVFAVALAFADFVFFLATMRASLCSERQPAMSRGDADNQTTTRVDGQTGTGDRNIPAEIVSYTERLRNAMAAAPAPASARVGRGRPPAQRRGLRRASSSDDSRRSNATRSAPIQT
jgi:hypothetical protein